MLFLFQYIIVHVTLSDNMFIHFRNGEQRKTKIGCEKLIQSHMEMSSIKNESEDQSNDVLPNAGTCIKTDTVSGNIQLTSKMLDSYDTNDTGMDA